MLTYCHQQIREEGYFVTDHVVLVDGSRIYGRHTTTFNEVIIDDWIFECGVFAANVAPPRAYKPPPNYEFI